MNWLRSFVFALSAVALAACASAPSRPADGAGPEEITILIGIDGFRADYLDRGETPVMSRLAAEGVRGSMSPSFPSVTFPNHYTLVTGRTPDHHGLINNRMEDPERPGVVFTLNDRAVTSDPIWWNDAAPLWVSAERQGVRTGTMFWPGSEFEIRGQRPSQYRVFDQSMPSFSRVDVLLSWLDLPAEQRPRFFTLYFDIVDTAGHRWGPDSIETTASAAEVDAALGRLLAGLRARGYEDRANLVIAADHGMARLEPNAIIDVDALITPAQARVIFDGQILGVTPLPGQEAQVAQVLLGRGAHGECWRKGELPARFDFGTHRRVPAIMCMADIGWRYRSTQLAQYGGSSLGAHGYDPDASEMAAVFLAHGPAFAEGVTLAKFRNVSVYPLLARLAGVTPEANQGDISDFNGALAN